MVAPFTRISELLDALDHEGLQGRVDTLGIVAHGATMRSSVAGEVHISPVLTATTVPHAPAAHLVRRLGDFIPADGTLVFVSCRAGAGEAGSQLLRAVSQLLPGRSVAGYVSYGAFGGGIGNTMAGVVTDTLSGTVQMPPPGYPRFYPGCPSEKVARNGHIVRHPDIRKMWEQLERVDRPRAQRLYERWSTGRSTMVRHRRDAYGGWDWNRPWTGYDYDPSVRERTVEQYYAAHELGED